MSTSTMNEKSTAISSDSWRKYPLQRKLVIRDRLKFLSFQKQYGNDRVAFSHDCIDWGGLEGLKPHQERGLSLVDEYERVSWRSPHGLGKSTDLTLCVFHALLTNEDVKVPTTASAWRQLDEYLWPEIHKWSKRLKWDVICWRGPFDIIHELLTLSLRLSDTCRSYAVACDDPASIEGAHAEFLLQGFDESKTIPPPTWDAAEGSHPTKWVAISTPGSPFGRFYDIHARKPGYEDWIVDRWTLEEGLESGMVSEAWVENRRRQWGENSPMFQNRVLGNFASYDESALIPLAWVEAAIERWHAWRKAGAPLPRETIRKIGCDPAGSGSDKAAIIERFTNLGVTSIEYHPSTTEMELAGLCKQKVESNGSIPWELFVEVGGGYGGGVVSRLKELGIEAISVVPSAKSTARDISGELEYLNLRAQLAWAIHEWLNPENGNDPILPPDDRLTADLVSLRSIAPTSMGKIRVESKDDLKKADRLGRSPDGWDSLGTTFAPILRRTSLKATREAVSKLNKSSKPIMPTRGQVF